MRIPDPKANTTTEAYLAYKAGYLEESELKPVLYEPYLHFDAWLAYWAGLTTDYPNKGARGKNLFDVNGTSGLFRANKTVSDQTITSTATAAGTGYVAIVIPNSDNLLGKECSISFSAQASIGDARFRIADGDSTNPSSVGSVVKTIVGNGNKTETVTFPTSYGTGKDCFVVLLYPHTDDSTWNVGDYATYTNIQLEQGSTATSYEPYYAIPEMLCDEEALVAYLSGVTNTYPEEIKDPYDVRIVGYLKHLVSVRWPEPDYPVNNEEFYLSTMEPTHTSNSEPSSDIELDTAEGKIISVEAYGDTYQQTYSGKNLFDKVAEVETSPNYSLNPDGTITTDASNAQTGRKYMTLTMNPGTYTLSFRPYFSGVENPSIRFTIRNLDASTDYIVKNINNPKNGSLQVNSFTVENTTSVGFCIIPQARLKDGQTFYFYDTQLELGSTSTPYEPYTGGISAPNPDYPQDVQVVTGEQTVTVTGKNAVNLQGYSSYGVTGSVNGDGSITISGTATSTAGEQVLRSQQTLKAGTYTMTISRPLPFLLNFSIAKGVNFRIPAGSTSATTTLSEDYINQGSLFMAMTAGTTYNETFNLQIVAGSTPDYDFEPYHLQSYEINLGKNIWSSSMEVGGISANGTSLSNDKRVRSTTKVVVRPGTTYTLSATPRDSGKVINVAIQGWTSDGTFLSQITGADWQTLPLTFTTPANCYNVTLNGRYSDDTVFGTVGESTDAFQNIQLEAGANATEYAQYFPPVELCKIGDYQDYIYKSGDDWYVHKEVGKAIFDGTESWSGNTSTGSPTYLYAYTTALDSLKLYSARQAFCSHFSICPDELATGTSVSYPCMSVVVPSAGTYAHIRLMIPLVIAANTNALRAWLGYHNTNLYYVLATETDTKITDATLIGQLEALAGADTYNEKTYIKVTANDPNLPALLKVEAYKY